jgi:hypothetical protein
MLLYHFTSRSQLPAILREGLLYGRVPIAPNRAVTAVWLTSDPGPDGHGLEQGGRVMTDDERLQAKEWSAVLPSPGTRYAKEASVRIAVELSETDRNLHQWLPWARRNLPPEFLAAMYPAGASLRQAKTWRLYSAVILPGDFVAVDRLDVEAARAA